jgi:hypothetical protein
LFPLYWLALASIKGEAALNGPPAYLPFIDFAPELNAWRFILDDPYENLRALPQLGGDQHRFDDPSHNACGHGNL